MSWKPIESVRKWKEIACDKNAEFVMAIERGGNIYTSKDGNQFQPIESLGVKEWNGCCMSKDGKYCIATAFNEYTYASNDFGTIWNSIPTLDWMEYLACKMSGDGRVQMITFNGGWFISNDHGQKWNRTFNRSFVKKMAFNHDGSIMWIIDKNNLLKSTDEGKTFELYPLNIVGPNALLRDVACDQSGKIVTILEYMNGIHLSKNGGDVWKTIMLPKTPLYSILLSKDGQKQILSTTDAVMTAGKIYFSQDFGETWQKQELSPSLRWISLASDEKLDKIYGTAVGSTLYICKT